MNKSRTIRWILLVLAVALLGYYGWYRFYGVEVAAKSGPTTPPVRVSIAPVERADFPVYLTGLGTVQGFNTVVVRTRVDGQIDKAGEDKSDKALLAAIAKLKDASKPLRAGEGDASENFATLGEVLSSLAADIEGSDRTPTRAQRDLLAATNQRLDHAARRWDQIRAGEIAELNAQFKAAGLADITVPEADQIQPERAPEAKELP